MFISFFKNRLYRSLVEFHPEVRAHYEGFKDSNPEYHKNHRFQSIKFLHRLRKFYKNGAVGEFPQPPVGYQIKQFLPLNNTPEILPGTNIPFDHMQNHTSQKPLPSSTKQNTPVVSKDKLPYLDGAESLLFKRQAPHYVCRTLLQYDVISFDIFDTLLFRPFSKPSDLFVLLGEQHHILNFKNIRMEAEKQAREQHKAIFGNTEVTIDDIYEIIEKKTGLSKQLGIQAEVDLEIELVRPNPYCKRLFDLLKCQGKRLIACSDMYLPKKYIHQLLSKCGYIGFEEIYVSCEYTFSKRSKGMYSMLRNKYGHTSKIAHMGDNYEVDIKAARASGIDAYFSKNCNIAGMQYRAENMSPLIGSAYAGIVNLHLHNGLYSYSPFYEYGYIYGGIYVLGYCHWIYQHAKQHNVKKIFFLSRDGYIYKKVFDSLFKEIDTSYIYWSRTAGMKYTMEYDFNEFLTRMLTHKINNPNVHDSIEDLLKILTLEHLIPKLKKFKLSRYEELSLENKEILINFFVKNKQNIIKHFEPQREFLKEIICSNIDGADAISIVDVGWIGSGPLGLKYLIKDVWKLDCNVFCLLAANRHYDPAGNATVTATKEVESYLFNNTFNLDNFNSHSTTNKNTNNLYFEQFTQAPMPSFEGVYNGEFLFDLPEIENYEKITEIHNGIMDFATEYTEYFKKFPFMFNISGHDAYMPFRMIIKDLTFIKKYISTMTYARSVGSNKREQKIETLGDILTTLNL